MHATTRFFAVLVAIMLVLPIVSNAEWTDTGFDVVPGYKVMISLSAKGKYFVVRSWGNVEASFGYIDVKLVGKRTFFGIDYYLQVYYNGKLKKEEKVDSIGFMESKEVAAKVIVDSNCDGYTVITMGTKNLFAYNINGPQDILYNIDGNGDVTASTLQKYQCSSSSSSSGSDSSNSGNPPPPSSKTVLSSLGNIFGTAATAFVVIVSVGLAVIILVIVFSQAKKRKLLAR